MIYLLHLGCGTQNNMYLSSYMHLLNHLLLPCQLLAFRMPSSFPISRDRIYVIMAAPTVSQRPQHCELDSLEKPYYKRSCRLTD